MWAKQQKSPKVVW